MSFACNQRQGFFGLDPEVVRTPRELCLIQKGAQVVLQGFAGRRCSSGQSPELSTPDVNPEGFQARFGVEALLERFAIQELGAVTIPNDGLVWIAKGTMGLCTKPESLRFSRDILKSWLRFKDLQSFLRSALHEEAFRTF